MRSLLFFTLKKKKIFRGLAFSSGGSQIYWGASHKFLERKMGGGVIKCRESQDDHRKCVYFVQKD